MREEFRSENENEWLGTEDGKPKGGLLSVKPAFVGVSRCGFLVFFNNVEQPGSQCGKGRQGRGGANAWGLPGKCG